MEQAKRRPIRFADGVKERFADEARRRPERPEIERRAEAFARGVITAAEWASYQESESPGGAWLDYLDVLNGR